MSKIGQYYIFLWPPFVMEPLFISLQPAVQILLHHGLSWDDYSMNGPG